MTAGAFYAGRFGTAVSLLITIPIARGELGPQLFGVWMLLSAMLSFFAFADLGVGNVVLNRITAARAVGDTSAATRAVAGGYLSTGAVGIGIVLAWLAWCAMASDPSVIVGLVSVEDKRQVMTALHIFVVLLALNVPASLVQKIQLGTQAGHWVGVTQLLASAGTLIAIPTALHFDGQLPSLVLCSLGILVFANLANTLAWWLHRRAKEASRPGRPTASDIASLFKAGTLFLAVQLASAFAFQSDAIVITQMLGQAEYGDYAAIQRLYVFASMLISAALAGLWPAFGDALARGEVAWVRQALKRALGMTLLVMGGLCLLLAVSMGTITKLWLGTSHAPSLLLTSLLSLWALIEALGMVAGSLLNGAGVLRAQAVLALTMAAVSFGGKWALVAWTGVEGAVLATIIAYCCISVPAQIILVRRLFRDASNKSLISVATDREPEDSPGAKQT